jgi:predicted acylesterase/phospholipase RssA
MKHLVFGPGAMGYFMFLGALSALSDANALNELESICGASSGSLVAFMFLATKGDIGRAIDHSLSVPIRTVMKPNIKVLLNSYGLVSSKKIRRVIEDVALKFIGSADVTFAELYAYNPIKLFVSACCVDLHATHYFSVETTPSMSVIDALCMSIAIPFFFESIRYGPWHFMDGGVLESLPGGPLLTKDPKTILAFTIEGGWIPRKVKNLPTYVIGVISAFMGLRHTYPMFPRIGLDTGLTDAFDFGASNDAKLRLFFKGYGLTKKYFCTTNANDPACCVQTPPEPEEYPCSGVVDPSGVLVRPPGVDDSCEIDARQESRSAGSRTPSPSRAASGPPDDVGLLDDQVAERTSSRVVERDSQGWSEASQRSSSVASH